MSDNFTDAYRKMPGKVEFTQPGFKEVGGTCELRPSEMSPYYLGITWIFM